MAKKKSTSNPPVLPKGFSKSKIFLEEMQKARSGVANPPSGFYDLSKSEQNRIMWRYYDNIYKQFKDIALGKIDMSAEGFNQFDERMSSLDSFLMSDRLGAKQYINAKGDFPKIYTLGELDDVPGTRDPSDMGVITGPESSPVPANFIEAANEDLVKSAEDAQREGAKKELQRNRATYDYIKNLQYGGNIYQHSPDQMTTMGEEIPMSSDFPMPKYVEKGKSYHYSPNINIKASVTGEEMQSPYSRTFGDVMYDMFNKEGYHRSGTGKVHHTFNNGGPMNIYGQGAQMSMGEMNDIPVNEFNTGGTHQENPYGGIYQGMGANGKPNLVEEGEYKVTLPGGEKYVVTNRDIKLDKETAKEFNIPKKYIGNTMKDMFSKILNKKNFLEREGDSIDNNSANSQVEPFIKAHQKLSAIRNAEEAQKEQTQPYPGDEAFAQMTQQQVAQNPPGQQNINPNHPLATQFDFGGKLAAGAAGFLGGALGKVPFVGDQLAQGVANIHDKIDPKRSAAEQGIVDTSTQIGGAAGSLAGQAALGAITAGMGPVAATATKAGGGMGQIASNALKAGVGMLGNLAQNGEELTTEPVEPAPFNALETIASIPDPTKWGTDVPDFIANDEVFGRDGKKFSEYSEREQRLIMRDKGYFDALDESGVPHYYNFEEAHPGMRGYIFGDPTGGWGFTTTENPQGYDIPTYTLPTRKVEGATRTQYVRRAPKKFIEGGDYGFIQEARDQLAAEQAANQKQYGGNIYQNGVPAPPMPSPDWLQSQIGAAPAEPYYGGAPTVDAGSASFQPTDYVAQQGWLEQAGELAPIAANLYTAFKKQEPTNLGRVDLERANLSFKSTQDAIDRTTAGGFKATRNMGGGAGQAALQQMHLNRLGVTGQAYQEMENKENLINTEITNREEIANRDLKTKEQMLDFQNEMFRSQALGEAATGIADYTQMKQANKLGALYADMGNPDVSFKYNPVPFWKMPKGYVGGLDDDGNPIT
jgi:hypothetical protein